MSIGYDLTYEINEFGNAKIKSEIESIRDIVLFILFTKPGQYPSMPDIGLDIDTVLYSFYDNIDIRLLRNQIVNQCSALGVYFDAGNIEIQKMRYQNHPIILIQITGLTKYPADYQADDINTVGKYDIALTHDELNKLVIGINFNKD